MTVPFLLAIAVILPLMACISSKPATADTFKETFEELGYTVVDVTEHNEALPYIIDISTCKDNSVYLEFFEVDITGYKIHTEIYKSGASQAVPVKKYAFKVSEKYYLIEQTGSAFRNAYNEKPKSEKANNTIKRLRY